MPPEVLSLRALNRALLSRQLLLDRPDLPDDADARKAAVISAIEHLPSAPRPDDHVPAPVRLVAEFDNLLLSHADRSRVVSAEYFKRFLTINGVIPGSVLIDGFVAGLWRLARNSSSATLAIELFGPGHDLDEVVSEAERMLAFCAPGASADIRFAALG
jgi:Winged helix DNA-binding domain